MQVAIRVDSSVQIGTGHVMRCLTLASRLRQYGVSVEFICRELTGNLCDLIQNQSFIVHRLPPSSNLIVGVNYDQWLGTSWEIDSAETIRVIRSADTEFDLIIVDHYAIDWRWESRIRPFIPRMMAIDDLANRMHDCDLLLDQNLYDNMHTRYLDLVPEKCTQLLGPRYALLREEFIEAQKTPRVRDGDVQRVFVFFGGSDPTNETEKALEAIKLLNRTELIVDVVVGSTNPNRDRICELCSHITNVHFYCQISNISDLMVEADLAIGAGGTSTWERCSVGLPALTVTTAENQVEVTDAVAKTGAIHHLGFYRDVSPQSIAEGLQHLLQMPGLLVSMSRMSTQIMGNLKAAGSNRIAEIILAGEVTS
ncbi:UDP-2,4-diacetamido-2,4,6-trideoxy-beta-L-altropyranose hydrolase [Paenibacillus sp. 5J-6]|uniref:UDP-2,4-diacetamido-2,4, 6-trideoxy-beta-L-altropyranose hydrolase n=1 Tax=Paenibacillus silvestris TaxID=2606219 RepID=A0A6L8V641_9BACL|nr:UDP-2,4-diacetamido-2,4,6-trideoxy-beta-L-altropyranose hydrolase [Paenibacillus silvestris]MZQ85767.1 UDP-2,4-diacetamido-2,4,6-trideoxy-beta-L-altropyranose hydrolase [Paenibacillus silvestris]